MHNIMHNIMHICLLQGRRAYTVGTVYMLQWRHVLCMRGLHMIADLNNHIHLQVLANMKKMLQIAISFFSFDYRRYRMLGFLQFTRGYTCSHLEAGLSSKSLDYL